MCALYILFIQVSNHPPPPPITYISKNKILTYIINIYIIIIYINI